MILNDIKEEVIMIYYSKIIISCIISYLCGSIPTGVIISKINHVDILKEGSGSPGYTNVKRVLGFKWGAIVFILDIIKTIIPIIIFYYIINNKNLIFLSGLFVIIGHNYPIFNHFKGGKGITCSVATCACFNIYWAIILFIIYYIIKKLTGYVSIGSMFALIFMFLSATILINMNIYPFTYENNKYAIPILLIIALINIYRHKDNIKRLIKGEENHI